MGFKSLIVILAMLLSACGGGWSGYYIPADTKLKPFQAPETDELVEEEDEEEEEEEEEPVPDDEEEAAPAPAKAPSK